MVTCVSYVGVICEKAWWYTTKIMITFVTST
jgi:hypothetical protein